MKKVSIIVPVYNNEKYISKCIESLLSQTIFDIEIIVVDDGSTDATYEIAKQYQDQIVLLHHKNKGVSYSRNRGIKRATGEYLMFVDGDDWIEPNMVESMLKIIENECIDIVRCGYIREYPNKKEPFIICPQKKKVIGEKDFIYQMFIHDYRLASPCCQLIRKVCIETLFDETIQVGEDYLFNLALYTRASSFAFLPDLYYHYLYNPVSATTYVSQKMIEKRCEDALTVYSKLYEYLEKWNCNNPFNRKKVSYRIAKELNMKLLVCFQTNAIPKENQKQLIAYYFQHPLLKKARYHLSILTIFTHIDFYTPFLFCIKMSFKKLYYYFGKTIYRRLYSMKK